MKRKYMKYLSIIVPILLAAICLFVVVKNNNQAGMAIPLKIDFSGEYSFDGEHWYPYTADEEISALDGDVIIKGHLSNDLMEGAILNIFCNHIGVSIYVNGEKVYIDTPTELRDYGIDLMPSMCGKLWKQTLCPLITTEDEIEFHLINNHKHGNKNAYKEAIASLYLTPQDSTILEVYLKPYIKPFQYAGYALLIVAVLLLGAAISAVLSKSTMAKNLFVTGLATLFTGGYMVFDVMMIYLLDELLVLKTYGRQLCLMLALYFLGKIICDSLKGNKKITEFVMGIYTTANIVIFIVASTGKILLYDTQFWWGMLQCVVSIVLIVLCILELKEEKKNKVERIAYITVNVAILLDMAGVGYHTYYSGICFKAAFIMMLVVLFFKGVKQVILDHQASIKNKKLKEELEQSRISIMLSQIQPHFLYNSLTSVMDLCDRNPKEAKAAIADFADYLRGNLSSLKTENLISFGTELEHIEKYLKLEKLRFQEELEVVYDIQAQDFMLPALSVQPLIENAVKHGVGQKIGGGTVSIHTYETEEDYIIRITDDGVGFVEGEYADEDGTHVGIENTRKRLHMMMNARLEMQSKKGEGTTACIFIPKRRD